LVSKIYDFDDISSYKAESMFYDCNYRTSLAEFVYGVFNYSYISLTATAY
jgi:hypothetical protein